MPPIPRPRIMLRYAGLFDFDTLYTAVIDWAKMYNYQWFELDYKHKVPTPYGAEQQWKWLIEKNVTEYINYKINLTVHIWDMQEVVVEIDGKKKSLTKGRINIWMDGTMEYDWQRRFKGSAFAAKLGDWYRNIVYKKDTESLYFDQLYYRMWNLHNVMKKILEMQTSKYAYKDYLKEA